MMTPPAHKSGTAGQIVNPLPRPVQTLGDYIARAQAAEAAPDPMAGLRGMLHPDCETLVRQCMREAGIAEYEFKDVKPMGWNICFRIAQAAHKAGAAQMKNLHKSD